MNKSRQVLGKGCEILCLGGRRWARPGQRERDELQLKSCEVLLCVDLSQDDGHLRGYSMTLAQGHPCQVGRRTRRIKKELKTMRIGFWQQIPHEEEGFLKIEVIPACCRTLLSLLPDRCCCFKNWLLDFFVYLLAAQGRPHCFLPSPLLRLPGTFKRRATGPLLDPAECMNSSQLKPRWRMFIRKEDPEWAAIGKSGQI
ncbi:uncharacterized protein LOC125690309 isoform X2 [Lagopus muta]|uniref:uncharacterized protein LOC125690309 isoform X2 n=1 Tax=Lagopus muta TaxID=64668 RepID=UPI00209EB017|nr:uncharacterized protein LOC125690309 isoform X2 [Lagopus muta]